MELGTRVSNSNGPSLSKENYINLGAFVVNVVITYVGNTGVFGGSNAEISEKYQTIITPAGWAFSIWAVIFLWEAVFCIVQMLPAYRANQLVTAVPWPWLVVCLGQAIWTVTFSQQLITLSTFVLLAVWCGLVTICWRQDLICQEQLGMKLAEKHFWLFCMPFQIHLGWMTAASVLNINLAFVEHQGEHASVLLSVAILSIAALTIAVLAFRDYSAVGFVLAWASAAIASELGSPKESIAITFPPVVIAAIKDVAMTLSILFAVLTCANIAVSFVGIWRGAPLRKGPVLSHASQSAVY